MKWLRPGGGFSGHRPQRHVRCATDPRSDDEADLGKRFIIPSSEHGRVSTGNALLDFDRRTDQGSAQQWPRGRSMFF